MDYVDFIVHVFSAEKRAFYGLERLRKSATTISVAELSAELKTLIASTRNKTAKPVKVVKKDVVAKAKTLSAKTPVKSEKRMANSKSAVKLTPTAAKSAAKRTKKQGKAS